MQSDPIAFQFDDNYYAYGAQSPLIAFDSTGEIPVLPPIIAFCTRLPRICAGIIHCVKNPANCKEKICRLLKVTEKIIHPVCDKIPSCISGEPCAETTAKLGSLYTCYALRQANDACYKGGGDYGHDMQFSQVLVRISKCTELLPINCSGCVQ